MCSPPPRDKKSQAALWQGLQDGLFDILSSDHAPYRFDEQGKKLHGMRAPFRKVANGLPGLETRAPLLFSEGVGTGRIGLERFVALNSTNAARIYGLYPRKGTIAVGSDADIAIWDPERKVTIRNADLHHNVDYTPYEGMTVTGWPTTVLSRGEIICADGAIARQRGPRPVSRMRRARAGERLRARSEGSGHGSRPGGQARSGARRQPRHRLRHRRRTVRRGRARGDRRARPRLACVALRASSRHAARER